MAQKTSPSWHLWLAIVLLIVISDQLSKFLILQTFAYGEGRTITSFFNLVRVHNTGAAFSFLANAGGWQRWFFTAIAFAAVLFMSWMIRQHPQQRLFCTSLSLIMGGAMGNVIDRLMHGYVVDFFDFHWPFLSGLFYRGHFPAFNIADASISVGAALLILDEILRVRRGR